MMFMPMKYEITVPKFDNEGHRIKIGIIRSLGEKMARHFNGVTILPKSLGCFVSEESGELQCEENAILYAIRVPSEPVQDQKDRMFMENIASELGVLLGQEAILSIEDEPDVVSFIKGKRKNEVEKKLRETDTFSQLVD